MTFEASQAHGTELYIGDGGVGAGTKASRTMGSSNQTLVVGWNEVGTAGNSKTVEVIENGNNTPLSVTVTTSAVVINVETDGSGNSLSTVNDVIAKLYQDETFAAYWFATDGAGDGTGLVDTDHASAVLSGGAAGTEVFTLIEGIVEGPDGPGFDPQVIEAKHHSSSAKVRKPTGVDISPVTFTILFDSTNAAHADLLANARAQTRTNFREKVNEEGIQGFAFAAYIGCSFSMPPEDFTKVSFTLSVDGEVTDHSF